MEELLLKAKQTLSIIPTATAKDEEIKSLISAGLLDLERQGIITDYSNDLVVSAIMMFVKGHFGNVEIKNKELALKTYRLICENLGLSSDYLGE